SALEKRGAQDFGNLLQPFLRFQEAQEPERDARIGGELFDRDSQKTRRAVHYEDAGAAVENPQLQTIEEDSGSARIIHHDVVFFQIGGKFIDDRIEVAIPTVPLDFVVGEAKTLDRLMRPIFLRYPIEAAGPYERRMLIRRRNHRMRNSGVQ